MQDGDGLCAGALDVSTGHQLLQQPPLAIPLLSKWASNTLSTSVLPCSCDKQMFNLFRDMSFVFFPLPLMTTPVAHLQAWPAAAWLGRMQAL